MHVSFSGKRRLALCVASLCVLVLLMSCKSTPDKGIAGGENALTSAEHGSQAEGLLQAKTTRERAPEFTLQDGQGQSVSLSDYKGKVVAIAFWATWCTACKAEMTLLKDVKKKYGERGFEVLSISIDTADKKARALSIVRSKRLNYPVLFDVESRVVEQYNPSLNLPYTAFIDRRGILRFELDGFLGNEGAQIENTVQLLLGE